MSDADIEEIRRITEEVTDGFNTGVVDQMMRHYADSYVDGNLRRPHQTWAERRDYYGQIIDTGRVKISVTPHEIEVSGERAYVWGDLSIMTSSEHGAISRRDVRYMEIWRRTADGWKAIWGMDGEIQVSG